MKVIYKNVKKENGWVGLITRFAALIFAATVVISFIVPHPPKEEKKYPVNLTIQEWNVVLGVIDNSNSPHQTVMAASKAIVDQIKVPYEADQKKIQDSLNKAQKPKQ